MPDTAPIVEVQLLERIEQLEEEMQALRMSPLAERLFVLDGERYPYHVARGNRTWDNERAVEIPAVREYLDAPDPRRTSLRCMRRTRIDNLWVQAPYAEVRDCRYNHPLPCANAIAIVELMSARQAEVAL